MARGESPVHRIDPRAKVATGLFFAAAVVSFDRTTVAALMPYAFFPVYLARRGGVPIGFLARRLAVAMPFALAVALPNPFFDRAEVFRVGPVGVTGGWLSLASVMVRFVLTAGAALALAATTGISGICRGLAGLGVPRAVVTQLLLLYRYLFVLLEEGLRTLRAWRLRSFAPGPPPLRLFVPMAGRLLLRTLDRSGRLHMAMLARGFDGRVHAVRPLRFGPRDVAFLAGWTFFFAAARWVDLSAWLGRLATGGLP
nr:cobalt ECF transporter T component CbiQ [Dissulfurirhabdus thermomarina]